MSAYVSISAVPQPGDTQAFKHRTGNICGWRIGPLTIQFASETDARKWLAECVNTLNATGAPAAEVVPVATLCLAGHDDYICTEPVDHEGDHIASGGLDEVCNRWPR